MRNGFFKLVNTSSGFGVLVKAPADGGEPVRVQELMQYLDRQNISYNLDQLKNAAASQEDTVVKLGTDPCPRVDETYILTVSQDAMVAVARFFPASETGERMTKAEFLNDMQFRSLKYGFLEANLDKHFGGAGFYCLDFPIAKGLQPRQGTDARIEYYFNTEVQAAPEVAEDGSVDYFNLHIINPVKAGDVLARIIPEDPGEYGMTVMGNRIKPRDVRKTHLGFGNNIKLSEDRLSITSMVNGHVMLIGGEVFVSNVYEVENVDTATGNIDFDGSVQVNGSVASNFQIKATGNVFVKGVVEGAVIEAGGNIIIARGMNGMAKGVLRAGGNIVAKYIENATVEAEGYVETESILHSKVQSGSQILVTGHKGFITGGHVQAKYQVEVRTLGSEMGASTVVEIGVNPKIKNRYLTLQKEVSEIVRIIKNSTPVVQAFMEKKAKGARITPEQVKHVQETAALIEKKKLELTEKSAEMQTLSEQFTAADNSCIKVMGAVFPGTTIVIGDSSMNLQTGYKYCRFVRQDGEVKMLPL